MTPLLKIKTYRVQYGNYTEYIKTNEGGVIIGTPNVFGAFSERNIDDLVKCYKNDKTFKIQRYLGRGEYTGFVPARGSEELDMYTLRFHESVGSDN